MSDTIAHVIIRGQVQGVGYRAFVEDEAAILGLEGWIRNRLDGSVEAVFAGPADAVETMIEACRQGPWSARVEAVDVRTAKADVLALRSREKFAVLATE